MMKQIMSDTIMAINVSLSGKGAGRRAGEKEKLDGSRVLKMVKGNYFKFSFFLCAQLKILISPYRCVFEKIQHFK